jgi:hypothetical protein
LIGKKILADRNEEISVAISPRIDFRLETQECFQLAKHLVQLTEAPSMHFLNQFEKIQPIRTEKQLPMMAYSSSPIPKYSNSDLCTHRPKFSYYSA